MTPMSVLTQITALAARHVEGRDREISATPTSTMFKPLWSFTKADHHKRVVREPVPLTNIEDKY